MSKKAFFIQADSLLLPEDFPDSQIDEGLPLELFNNFLDHEFFEIPSINDNLPSTSIVSVSTATQLPQNWRSIPIRRILTMFCLGEIGNPAEIVRACHIVQWRRDSRFCGTCGSRNNDVPGHTQRLCPGCGRSEFPRICPAVIVIITDDQNRILLAHNKRFRNKVYSHISGFNEAGETLEETVVREIREEINIEVKDIVYITSQPWPFPNSLMLGFKAKYSSGTIQPDGDEIIDAQWFTSDNLPELPGEGSLSRFLIESWLKNQI